MAVRVVGNGREQFNSDPILFRKLTDGYRSEQRRSNLPEGLVLLEPKTPMPALERNRQAYWLTQLTNGAQQQITVAQPSAEFIHAMDFNLLLPSFSVMALVMIGGTLISEVLGSLLEHEFARILMVAKPSTRQSQKQISRPSLIHEFNTLAKSIRLASRRLEASNTRYRNFFNLPIVGTAITSTSKGWVEVNDETCRILGYSRDELFCRTWAELTHPEDLVADEEQFQRMLRREIDGYELEKRFIRKDGTIAYTLLAGGCGPIGNQPVDLCYVNLIDITQRKQVEADLAAAQERERTGLQRQRELLEEKLKTSLTAAAVAHEIKQPLSSIHLNCRLALQQLGKQPPGFIPLELDERLRHLASDSDQVVATVERMRMLLRNVETHHGPVDLNASVQTALISLRPRLRQHQVKLSCFGLDRPCVLEGDSDQLQFAVANLLRNAIEAMDAKPPNQRKLFVKLDRMADQVAIVVADSGPGFSDAYSPDTSWELLQSTKASGMGIGLFIVQTAATNHYGHLRIGRSSELGGAEVRIELPTPAQQRHLPADRGISSSQASPSL